MHFLDCIQCYCLDRNDLMCVQAVKSESDFYNLTKYSLSYLTQHKIRKKNNMTCDVIDVNRTQNLVHC